MDLDLHVTGVTELAADLGQLGRDLGRLDLAPAGEDVQAALADLSPRLTGALAASWRVDPAPGEVTVASALVYAGVQNFGGYHNIVGRHFVERAAELTTDADDAARHVEHEIDRLTSRL